MNQSKTKVVPSWLVSRAGVEVSIAQRSAVIYIPSSRLQEQEDGDRLASDTLWGCCGWIEAISGLSGPILVNNATLPEFETKSGSWCSMQYIYGDIWKLYFFLNNLGYERGEREDKGSEREKRSDTESDRPWLPSSPETHSIKKRIRGNFIYLYNMKSGKTGNIGNKLSYLIVKEGDCWCKSSLTLAVLMSLILWLLPPEFVWSQDLGRAAAVKQVKYLNCPHPPSAHAVSC